MGCTAAVADERRRRPPRRAVALVGNPNCGKTALFNALTGSRQKVANYAGVTVERKEGRVATPAGRALSVLDLPGTYSLRARSPDEEVTRDAVLGKLAGETPPDVIVCVADATNLRLVLRLILELKAVGRPMVLALNMYDIAQRQGLRIDLDGLRARARLPDRHHGRHPQARHRRPDGPGRRALVAGALAGAPAPGASPTPARSATPTARPQRILQGRRPPAGAARHLHRQGRRACCCIRSPGWSILLALLFVMFQAVFTWAHAGRWT